MKMKSMKKIVSGVTVVAIMATLTMGAFSYFTDYESRELTANAGTLALSMTNATEDLTNGLTILNPGDSNDLSFTANNVAEKSMDVKAVITVTSSKGMSESDHQYKVTDDAGTELVGTISTDKKSIVYTIEDVVLSGSVEKDGASASKTYNYQFVMDENADNAWQDTDVEVDIELFAKQHRNTTAMSGDWTAIVEK